MTQKKQQLFYALGNGEICHTDLHFNCVTSLKSFNHKHEKNLAYVCVVDDKYLNLTPLGRVLMPPPLFEKQVKCETFPVHVDMYGHSIAALCSDNRLLLTDCINHEQHRLITSDIKTQRVSKMIHFKQNEDIMVVICEGTSISTFKVTEANTLDLVSTFESESMIMAVCLSANI